MSVVDGRAKSHVRDNGAGFDPTYAGRLFSPCTARTRLKATTVGLVITMRVTRLDDGELRAQRSPRQVGDFPFQIA